MKNIIFTLTILFFISCNQQNSKTDNSDWSGTISATDERNDLVNKFVDSIFNDNEVNSHSFAKAVRNQFLIQNIENCLINNKWHKLY